MFAEGFSHKNEVLLLPPKEIRPGTSTHATHLFVPMDSNKSMLKKINKLK